MITNSSKAFLSEALRIGDSLLTAMVSGMPPGKGLISGMPGIIIFLLQLYEVNPDQKYIDAAKTGIQQLQINERYQNDNYSLYTGHMGIAYILMRIYQFTGDGKCRAKALKLADDCAMRFLHYEYASDALFDGKAGCLHALLHLHAISGEQRLLNMINQFISKLIKNAQSDGSGLFWNMTNTNVAAECGYGFGASGIGYVFLELGYYFRNKTHNYIAEKAFQYENSHWNQERSNWPAYGKHITSPEKLSLHKMQYLSGNPSYFCESADDISYSGGAIGIGLARSRAFRLTQNQAYHMDVRKVCHKLALTYPANRYSSLNEGKAGYGLFFLEAFKTTKDPEHRKFALKIANDLYAARSANISVCAGDDLTLFSGLAGIGHFYLQISRPSPALPVANIAAPGKNTREAKTYPFIGLTVIEAKKIFLRKGFPRTIHLMETLANEDLHKYLQDMSGQDGSNEFIHWMQKMMPEMDAKEKQLLCAVFSLECRKKEIASGIYSGAYVHVKEICQMEKVEELLKCAEDVFMHRWLEIEEDVQIIETHCPVALSLYTHYEHGDLSPEKTYITLLKPTARNIMPAEGSSIFFAGTGQSNIIELQLGEMEQLLITLFTRPCKTKDAIEKVIATFKDKDPGSTERIAVQYIKDFLKGGILKDYDNAGSG